MSDLRDTLDSLQSRWIANEHMPSLNGWQNLAYDAIEALKAAAPQPEPSAGLREALEGVLRWAPTLTSPGYRAAADRARAALDAAPSPALDVERLARALFDALGWRSRYNPTRPIVGDDYSTYDPIPQGIVSGDADNEEWAALASKVVAEYDRLTAEDAP